MHNMLSVFFGRWSYLGRLNGSGSGAPSLFRSGQRRRRRRQKKSENTRLCGMGRKEEEAQTFPFPLSSFCQEKLDLCVPTAHLLSYLRRRRAAGLLIPKNRKRRGTNLCPPLPSPLEEAMATDLHCVSSVPFSPSRL